MKRVVAIVGLGMIGGSLAFALRKQGNYRLIGIDTNRDSCRYAMANSIIDLSCQSLSELEEDVDLVILATPISAFTNLAKDCRQYLSAQTVISDVGSTKKKLVEAFAHQYGTVPPQLVPAHPIAGSEQSSVKAASADLFVNRKVIITPLQSTASESQLMVETMWQQVGSEVIYLPIDYHDLVLAKTSHLPHLLAFALVHYLAGESENYDIFRFAAGGFRDFTRIASSDPDMWNSIFIANKSEILPVLDKLQTTLNSFKTVIAEEDTTKIHAMLSEAKAARDFYVNTL